MRSWLPLALAAVLTLVVVPTNERPPAAGGDRTLRNEDVVMRLVRGESPASVIAAIRAATPAFDLSDEMVRELEVAGVPGEVVRAMRERQAEAAAPAAGEAPAPEPPEVPALAGVRVAFEADGDAGAERWTLALPAVAPDGVASALEIPPGEDARKISGAALAVLCVEPRHVPDHWRSTTPLGRDFFGTPRHRVLAFEVGEAVSPKEGVLEISMPAGVEAPLEGPEHRLVAGIAIEIGDRWYLFRSVALDDASAPPIDLRVAVRSPRSPTLGQELERVRPD